MFSGLFFQCFKCFLSLITSCFRCRMKKFFQKIKLDAKFRNAGEGHRLTDSPSHSGAVQRSQGPSQPIRHQPLSESRANAAIAAIERSQNSKPAKKTVKLPEDERCSLRSGKAQEKSMPSTGNQEIKEYSVDGVKFISALTGEVYDELDLINHYKEQLILKLSTDEKAHASCLMIYTLTKDSNKIATAIATMNRYLDNIIANESEEKYRKIRKANKVFSEKISCVYGAEEFLCAVGFEQKLLPNNSGEDEIYLVLPNDINSDVLKEAKELLSSCESLESKLFRDVKVFRASDRIMKFHLPDSFYTLSREEIKREQAQMTEEVELSRQLRTKAMREKPKSNRKYKYALLRVKFPDGCILQGTFGVYEKLEALKAFVRECLNVDWVPFDLKTSLGKVLSDDDQTLLDLSLVPYAVLNVAWLPDVQAQLHEQGIMIALKDEILRNIREISS